MNPLLLIGLVLLAYAWLTGGLVAPIQRAAQQPTLFLGFVIAILLGITVHEFMHAYVANRLGDDTARLMGRMSLNPMAHLDPFGTLLIVLAGFGYGKPVPFNESRLRSRSPHLYGRAPISCRAPGGRGRASRRRRPG